MKVRMKWEWVVQVARYGEFWRQARKLLDRGLRTGALAVYRPVLQTKAHVLLIHLLENPEAWKAHLEQFVVLLLVSLFFMTRYPTSSLTGELVLIMAYGYEVQGRDDRKVDIAREMVQLASEISLPGALLINNLPFCESSPSSCGHSAEGFTLVRYIPEWLPWFSYKPLARYGHDLGDEVMHAPMSFVRESMVRKNLGNRACFNIRRSLD